MKKQYQITKKQAEDRFTSWAAENEIPLQFTFETKDVVELAKSSLGDLLRKVGKIFIESVMEAEVVDLVGKKSKPNQDRQAYRWGTEAGYCIVDGQRVPIDRPRVRSNANDKEIPLGSYELFQRTSLIHDTVWHKIMHGLTMRGYKEVVQQFAEAYGLEKSTTSEHFVEASRLKLEQLMKRSLAHIPLAVMMVDGTIFKGECLVVAIGIDRLGNKVLLGIRQGSVENSTVIGELFGELAERGVKFDEPRLYVVDGSRAIRKAIISYAGDAAFIQRCQVHKIRNVTEHLPEERRSAVKFRMRVAYSMEEAVDAKNELMKLHDELLQTNPSAAGSLAEGMDETLTTLELRLPTQLNRSLSSTNGIESSFSVVERICEQVKRWQGSDHRLRWVASALLFVESRWNKLRGFRHMPVLVNGMHSAYKLRRRHLEANRIQPKPAKKPKVA